MRLELKNMAHMYEKHKSWVTSYTSTIDDTDYFQARKECKTVKDKKVKVVEEKKELMKLLSTSQVRVLRSHLQQNFCFRNLRPSFFQNTKIRLFIFVFYTVQ